MIITHTFALIHSIINEILCTQQSLYNASKWRNLYRIQCNVTSVMVQLFYH